MPSEDKLISSNLFLAQASPFGQNGLFSKIMNIIESKDYLFVPNKWNLTKWHVQKAEFHLYGLHNIFGLKYRLDLFYASPAKT